MKYMGSKNRIAKHLKPFLEKHLNGDNYYIEPFVGGANMIDKIDYNKRIGADYNEYLIALLTEMQKEDFEAPKVSEDFFYQVKENQDNYDKWLVGYIGTQLSFGAMWFGSYRRDTQGKRDYCREARNNVNKQAKVLRGIKFIYSSYNTLEIPRGNVIYCDKPYEDTAKYKGVSAFNHADFWDWCREQIRKGNYAYISEYTAPEDFICIWEQEINNGLNKKKATEKLFVHKSQYQEALLD